MRRKILQDLANTLCQMAVGWRMGDDYERIASLPDGALTFDLLVGTVSHSAGARPELWIAGELAAWLRARLEAVNIDPSRLTAATLVVGYKTDRIETERKKLISFDFDCRSALETEERRYEGRLVERHVYHQRAGA